MCYTNLATQLNILPTSCKCVFFSLKMHALFLMLKSVDVSDWDTSSCTDMSFMFYGCKGPKSIDVFWLGCIEGSKL